MSYQSEATLENNLIEQLVSLGYQSVTIKDVHDLRRNLKKQLEIHNKITLSDLEFAQVLNKLDRGSVFERAGILRQKMDVIRDNGTVIYIELINQIEWCQNQYQVTHQINMEGKYKNRYDVTILVNGLPLVQIELKRRGLELKEAFNQTVRYKKQSYSGLFQYIQLFVISNGVNTKYYANKNKLTNDDFKQTFYWSDVENNLITALDQFAADFLEPYKLSKIITKYIVLHQSDQVLMVLRPYQFYATENIVNRVKNSTKNGYIWHTTGSGKTLTSFKTSQILTQLPMVEKVVFVVDRKDLDYQTIKEFNSFAQGSIDGTDSTRALVKQFADPNTKLIVTTIQKLNGAIVKDIHLKSMESLRNKKIVFIFDECHRSQFGETHKRITAFFNNYQMFGFTGTPIFADNASQNALGRRTTAELFDECLHKYVITDAIKDENVLKFSVEYVGKYKQKEDSQNNLDIDVEDIDRKELLESDQRLDKITDYIIANHDKKTHSREFTAMFCVGSIEGLVKYYDLLKTKKQLGKHRLNVATIFSYGVNEDDTDAFGIVSDTDIQTGEISIQNAHSRDKLEEYIGDYNQMFDTKYTTKDQDSFYNYYKDISKRVKNKEIDILLVVNMFLTGFDSKSLNTLYVDKNLRYHGLIQAFSRTNRILNEVKSQGNIVCFRNLKTATDEAITLFSNKEAIETILVQPYENFVDSFTKALMKLKSILPTVESADLLETEGEKFEFVRSFRELLRLKNILSSFADFKFEDLGIQEQEFEDYKSKYLDLHDEVRRQKAPEKVSILEDVDFELELIHTDEINVTYILSLLSNLKDSSPEKISKERKTIENLLSSEAQLRSKKDLILKFIDENLVNISGDESVTDSFEVYLDEAKEKSFNELYTTEGINPEKLKAMIDEYLYTQRKPLPDEIVNSLDKPVKLLERKPVVERVLNKIQSFVETFIEGI
jgi:type I restriction enzyme R subunit